MPNPVPSCLWRWRTRANGIPEEDLPLVLEPFFRTRPDGTGLGLATTYRIVRGLHGGIRARSTPGEGTVFTVDLPAVGAGRAERIRWPRAGPGGGTVLVVDDESSIRRMMTSALQRAGYHVLEAGTVAEALERAGGEAPDLAITDIQLGASDGAELARRLRRRWPELPVLFVSGSPPDFPLDPRTAFLPKPFGAELLLRTVSRMLASRSPQRSSPA